MSRKKLKIKKRRHITREELFPKKVDVKLLWMDQSIREAFPDEQERQRYVQDLYNGLGEGL